MDIPDPGVKLGSPAFQADSLPTELLGKPLMSFQVTVFGGDVETEKDPMVLVSHALCIPFVYGKTLAKE